MPKINQSVALVRLLVSLWALACAPIGGAQEQYPKPLIHTANNHPAARVLLLSIDGLHAVDLAIWVAAHPDSALAQLSRGGVTYTNAHTPVAEPAAGLIALATGGTPISTGIVTDDGYDRSLSPPGSDCRIRGTPILLSRQAESAHDIAADTANDAAQPRDPVHHCAAMPPHMLLRVNTLFEVVHEEYGPTAWAGENGTITDLLRGPSGAGLDDACSFPSEGMDLAAIRAADDARVAAVVRWIDGRNCSGSHDASVPALFGMSFGAFAAAQLIPGMGYRGAAGNPSEALTATLAHIDASIARIVKELRTRNLFDSTWVAVTAPYGQSPMDQRQRHEIQLNEIRITVENVQPNLVAHINGGGAAEIWLIDSSKTEATVQALNDVASRLGIQDIDAGPRLTLTLNSPEADPRMPDIVLQAAPGVLWTREGEHLAMSDGGTLDEVEHVALLVSGAQLTGRLDPTWVPTTQLAPLLLRALGMEKFDLQALHREHSPALPGIF